LLVDISSQLLCAPGTTAAWRFLSGPQRYAVVPIVALKIEDYAIIGDCETVALARAGSTGSPGRTGARRAYR